jgi:predicted RND superfamily exporter protein
VILAVVVCSILAAVGLSRLQVDDDLRSLLRNGTDDFLVVDEIADRFGAPDRDCIVRVTPATGSLFAPVALGQLRDLVDDLALIDGVEEVRSMFDIRRQGVAGALLPVIPRVSGPLDDAACAAARERCSKHPLIAGHLLSPDANAALLLVRLGPGHDTPAGADPVLAAIATLLAGREGLDGELTGLPALRAEAAQALRRDMIVFNALGMSLAVILSASVARSIPSTFVACVPPFVGAVWAMGVLGLCGAKINILTSVVPSLALVVGTCDSIHFIEDMRRSVRRGIDPFVASSGAIRRVGVACGLTSVVTAIGFASLAAARIEAVRTFGIAAAAGAMASFTAVTLLTPLLASLPFCRGMRLGRSSRGASWLASFLAGWSMRHARLLVPAALAATVGLGLLSSGLDADNRVLDALPRGAASSRALMHVDEEFGGAFGADVLVTWPAELDWREAEVLDGIAAVHGVLEAADPKIRAVSVSTVAGTVGERARRRLDPAPFAELLDPSGRLAPCSSFTASPHRQRRCAIGSCVNSTGMPSRPITPNASCCIAETSRKRLRPAR